MADTGTYNNIISAGAASVTVGNVAGEPSTYVVYDASKTVIAEGAIDGSSVTIPAPGGSWPPGYSMVIFRSGWSFNRGFTTDWCEVSAFRDGIGSFPDPPAFGSSPTPVSPVIGDPNDRGVDIPMHGLIGGNLQRYEIEDAVNPTIFTAGKDQGGTIAAVEACCVMEGLWYSNPDYDDGVRERPKYVTFPNDNALDGAHAGGSPRSGYAAGVAAAAAALGPGTAADILWWGGINEPTTPPQALPIDDAAANYLATRAAVRAGNSAALVLGPSDVGPTPTSLTGLGSLDTYLTDLGDDSPLDGLSMHMYNGYLGDFRVTDHMLGGVRALLVAHGRSATLPMFLTETGQIGPSGVTFDPRRLVQRAAQLYLTAERWGVPKEHIYLFLDGAIPGFNNIGLKDQGGGMTAVSVFLRVYSEEIWGKTYATALDFGEVGDNFYRGNVYRGDAGTLVSLMAQGNPDDTVTLAVSDAGPLTYSDWQGGLQSVAVIDGEVTLPITDLPIYLRLTAAATVSVADCGSGLKAGGPVDLAPAATVTGVAGRGLPLQALDHVNDGVYNTGNLPADNSFGFDVPAGFQPFDSPVPNLPASVTLTWGSPVTMRKVLIVGLLPWQQGGARGTAMTRGKLEYWNGSGWLPMPTVSARDWTDHGTYVNATTETELGLIPGQAAIYSFYDNRWCHNVDLRSPITTTRMRLTVERTGYGETPDDFAARIVGAAEYYNIDQLDFTQVVKVGAVLVIEGQPAVTGAPFPAGA